jgi:hypothetical protein
MHPHWIADLILYIPFLLGQWLFILKRMGMAVRSKTNPIRTRREYLYRNWDLLTVRMALELGIFYMWRYNDLTGFINNHSSIHIDYVIPQGKIVALLLGYCADSGLDWILTVIPFFQKMFPDLAPPEINGNGGTATIVLSPPSPGAAAQGGRPTNGG